MGGVYFICLKIMAKKSIPTAGQKQWGVVLNNHLSQAFDAVNGGLNTLSADPTSLTSDDEGYTFINTTTGELKVFKGTGDGSGVNDWYVIKGSSSNASGSRHPWLWA